MDTLTAGAVFVQMKNGAVTPGDSPACRVSASDAAGCAVSVLDTQEETNTNNG